MPAIHNKNSLCPSQLKVSFLLTHCHPTTVLQNLPTPSQFYFYVKINVSGICNNGCWGGGSQNRVLKCTEQPKMYWTILVLTGNTVPLRINLTWNAFANAIRTKLEREMKQQQNGYGTGAERIWNKQVLFNLFSRTRSHLQERILGNVPA